MRLKLLAVDDEPDVLNMLQAMLELYGCEVVAMTDSRQAAEQLEAQHFDGAFVDGQMPSLNGFELASCIRRSKLNADVPIAMLSGRVHDRVKGDEASGDVTYYIGKPIDLRKLKEILTAMDKRKES